MFEQTFRNLDNVLRQEAGCGTELDYIEQTSWMLFLKYLDDLEHERALEAELLGKAYSPIIEGEFQWSVWAAPKNDDGSFDHDVALTGDDLTAFVDDELFPWRRIARRSLPAMTRNCASSWTSFSSNTSDRASANWSRKSSPR